MKKKLAFEWGNEKRVKISDPGHSDSLFYEGYRQALAGVIEIMLASSEYNDSARICPISKEAEYVSDYNYPNNIIVFSGERGAGKSSAMLTFVEGLKNDKSGLYCDDFLEDVLRCELPNSGASWSSIKNMLRNAEFVSLSPIDPTILEKDGQILPMILSRMLRKFKETWENESKSNSERSLNTKNSLLRNFESCFQHICAFKKIGNQHKDYGKLDAIMDLGDSSRLKQDLITLVQELLAFCTGKPSCKTSSTYLVLMIDDTDVNIDQAYNILEDIRKYLIIPHLIIIMASDLNHLVQVIKNSFLKSFDKEVTGRMSIVEGMTHKYIAKLFPLTRQIILPDLSSYFKEHPENITLSYKIQTQKICNIDGKERIILPDDNESITDFQEQIFRLIYRKTGIIFLTHQRNLHFIIPDNMRLLGHFLSMLVQMQDVCSPDDISSAFFSGEGVKQLEHLAILQVRLQNLQRFRDYFLNTWVSNNLDYNHAEVIKDLDAVDVSRKVNFVCETMKKMLNDTVNLTPSYANMLDMLMKWEEQSESVKRKKFVFAVNTYFSLLGHCIAVETLISFYNQLSLEPWQSGCTFHRLQEIYGSQVFISQDQDVVAKLDSDTCCKVKWKVSPLDSGFTDRISTTAEYASLLLSLFFDYSESECQYVDYCVPIVNILYLSKESHQSQIAKSIFSEKVTQRIPDISWNKWNRIQTSSLNLILNWDVLNKAIVHFKRITYASSSDMQNDLKLAGTSVDILAKFYETLTIPFSSQPREVILASNKLVLATIASIFYDISALAVGDGNDQSLKKWIDSVLPLTIVGEKSTDE